MHALTPALERCDRVLGLRAGQVVFDLPTPEVDEARLAPLFATAS
jgi:ABC-type phosphate/phosphonate transport system ATPase subunit